MVLEKNLVSMAKVKEKIYIVAFSGSQKPQSVHLVPHNLSTKDYPKTRRHYL